MQQQPHAGKHSARIRQKPRITVRQKPFDQSLMVGEQMPHLSGTLVRRSESCRLSGFVGAVVHRRHQQITSGEVNMETHCAVAGPAIRSRAGNIRASAVEAGAPSGRPFERGSM
jgi:hypothetical protein